MVPAVASYIVSVSRHPKLAEAVTTNQLTPPITGNQSKTILIHSLSTQLLTSRPQISPDYSIQPLGAGRPGHLANFSQMVECSGSASLDVKPYLPTLVTKLENPRGTLRRKSVEHQPV